MRRALLGSQINSSALLFLQDMNSGTVERKTHKQFEEWDEVFRLKIYDSESKVFPEEASVFPTRL